MSFEGLRCVLELGKSVLTSRFVTENCNHSVFVYVQYSVDKVNIKSFLLSLVCTLSFEFQVK